MTDMSAKFETYRSGAINATKLSNHDEDRTLSRLGNNRQMAKMAAAIMLTMSGSPYIYYGEEIGMLGMKSSGDENVREPFLWEASASDTYRTKWRTPVYSTETSVPPLALQKKDLTSIYRVYEKFIKVFEDKEGRLKEIKFINGDNFNFGFDVVDYLGENEKTKDKTGTETQSKKKII
jgi:glycosidase